MWVVKLLAEDYTTDEIVGPFNTEDEAYDWSKNNLGPWAGKVDWCVSKLLSPEEASSSSM